MKHRSWTSNIRSTFGIISSQIHFGNVFSDIYRHCIKITPASIITRNASKAIIGLSCFVSSSRTFCINYIICQVILTFFNKSTFSLRVSIPTTRASTVPIVTSIPSVVVKKSPIIFLIKKLIFYKICSTRSTATRPRTRPTISTI